MEETWNFVIGITFLCIFVLWVVWSIKKHGFGRSMVDVISDSVSGAFKPFENKADKKKTNRIKKAKEITIAICVILFFLFILFRNLDFTKNPTIDEACAYYCYRHAESSMYYSYEYNSEKKLYTCYCTNKEDEIVVQVSLSEEILKKTLDDANSDPLWDYPNKHP